MCTNNEEGSKKVVLQSDQVLAQLKVTGLDMPLGML